MLTIHRQVVKKRERHLCEWQTSSSHGSLFKPAISCIAVLLFEMCLFKALFEGRKTTNSGLSMLDKCVQFCCKSSP